MNKDALLCANVPPKNLHFNLVVIPVVKIFKLLFVLLYINTQLIKDSSDYSVILFYKIFGWVVQIFGWVEQFLFRWGCFWVSCSDASLTYVKSSNKIVWIYISLFKKKINLLPAYNVHVYFIMIMIIAIIDNFIYFHNNYCFALINPPIFYYLTICPIIFICFFLIWQICKKNELPEFDKPMELIEITVIIIRIIIGSLIQLYFYPVYY